MCVEEGRGSEGIGVPKCDHGGWFGVWCGFEVEACEIECVVGVEEVCSDAGCVDEWKDLVLRMGDARIGV